MLFLLIICHDDAFRPTDELVDGIRNWIARMRSRGVLVHGNPLRPASSATTLRVRNGRRLLTEGPFADSDENICAYALIDCAHQEEAISIAAEHPMASAATIEVRAVWSELAAE